MAMPWSKAKQKQRDYETGVRDVKQLTALFDACFRIQREASEAAGRHIPLVVENVRGAQKWVGRSKYAFGSFHLWGDVPALMPTRKTSADRWGDDAVKGVGIGSSSWHAGNLHPNDPRNFWSTEGVKQHGSGREWFAGDGKISRKTGSKSPARKAASAMIAKIPLTLSRHVAASWYPAEGASYDDITTGTGVSLP